MVSYPVSVSYLLAVIAVMLFIVLAVAAFRKNLIRPLHLLASSGIIFFTAVIAAGCVYVIWKIVNIIHPQYSGMFMGDIYNAEWYRAAFTALSALLVSGIFIAIRKKFAMIEIASASIILWLAVLITAQAYIPAGSYIFLWPLVFTIALFALYVFRPNFSGMEKDAAILILSVPVLFFLTDILSTLYIGLTLRFVIVAGFITALFFILLLPLFELLAEKGGNLVVYVSGIIFIAALIGGSATSGFNSEKPKPDTITYALDSDTGKASWLSCDSVSDTWLKQFFMTDERKTAPEFYPMLERCLFKKHAFFSAPAPALDLQPPLAEIISDITADKRELKFRISSGRKAGEIAVFLKTGQGIENVSVNGHPLEEIDPDTLKQGHRLLLTMADLKNWKVIFCKSIPDAGYIISLNCRPGTKIEIRLMDISDALPDIAKWGLKLRPNDIMAGPDYLMQEGIMVVKKYML